MPDKMAIHSSRPVSFWSMFASPVATLESLRDRPQWLIPVLLSATLCVAVNFYVIRRIGLVRLINAAAQAKAVIDPQAAIQNALAHRSEILTFQALTTFVSSFVTVLVIAKVLWLLLTLFGWDILFKKILGIVAHVKLLSVVIRECMLALTVTLIRDLNTLDLRNPLATNPAFFFRPTSPAAYRTLSSLDVITLMEISLLIVGLTKVCPRLSLWAASLLVVIPWTIYVGATLLLPFLFS